MYDRQILRDVPLELASRLTSPFTHAFHRTAWRVPSPGPREAEQALVDMISAGEIHASIDQLTGTVSFHDDDET